MPTQHLPTGIDLYYESHGEGEPLVLIPGTGSSGDAWMTYQVPALSTSLRVITFDPRGTGRTTAYQGFYTIGQMAYDVVALLDHLAIPSAHVLGHSMGGRMALSMALDVPGRVKSLILAASGSGPAARPGDRCIPGLAYESVVGLMSTTYEAHIRRGMTSTTLFTQDFLDSHPEVAEAYLNTYLEYGARWPAYVRHCIARDTWEATHRLPDVTVPTLVVVGDKDTGESNHLAMAQVLRERIPNASYKELAGQSHGFFWQAPEESNAWILDWVKRHS